MKNEKLYKILEAMNRGFERFSNVVATNPIGWLIGAACSGALFVAFFK